MAFPLFDLPPEAVELVVSFVICKEDKAALRLVCKRSRDIVDGGVVAIKKHPVTASDLATLGTLVRAPWKLLRLEIFASSNSCIPYRLGLTDVAALAAVTSWHGLQVLRLGRNNLGGAGAAGTLAASLAAWPALQELSLLGSDIGAAGAAALATANLPALQDLNLSSCRFRAAGARALAAANWPDLSKLDLSHNYLCDEGAVALASAAWPRLRELTVSWNAIEDGGAAALAEAAWPLKFLDFRGNLGAAQGVVALRAALPGVNILSGLVT